MREAGGRAPDPLQAVDRRAESDEHDVHDPTRKRDDCVFGRPALDPGVLVFAVVVTLGTTVVFSLAPAMLVSRPDLVAALKESERGSGRHARALASLVVSEVALACLLLTAS